MNVVYPGISHARTLIVLDPNLADFARSNRAHKSRKAFMCRQATSHVLTLQPIIDTFLIRNMEDSWCHKNLVPGCGFASFARLPEWGPKRGPLLDDPPAGCSDVGEREDVGPFFGRISLIRTPPGHRCGHRCGLDDP